MVASSGFGPIQTEFGLQAAQAIFYLLREPSFLCFFVVKILTTKKRRNEVPQSFMSRLEKLQEFLIQDPSDSFTRYAIGLEYKSMKNFEEAAKTFEDLLGRDPDYLATYYQLGAVYNELARMDEARAIYNRGIAVARKAGDTHAAAELEAALDEIEEDYEM